jgi:rare lipoprotein A (peptidoglycan hydrolase)
MKGFPVQFIYWVKNVVNNGSVIVMVNDHLGPYSKTLRRVQQADALSPILFD